jgi:hypothetical protein
MNTLKSSQPPEGQPNEVPAETTESIPIASSTPSDGSCTAKLDASNDAVTAWKADAQKRYDELKPFYFRHHRRPGIHAEILRRHGLPANLNHAALALGISSWTLRKRLQRHPDNLLTPLRRYVGRKVNVPISPLNQPQ